MSGIGENESGRCLGNSAHPIHDSDIICPTCGTLTSGAQLGIYQIQQLLGQGRSGKAYLAVHQRSRQIVVVKLFPPDKTSLGLWEAARREIRTIAGLQHTALLPIYSCTTWAPENQSSHAQPLNEQMLAYSGRPTYLLTLCQHAPMTLLQFVGHYEQNGSRLSNAEQSTALLVQLLQLIQQAGSALSTLHMHNLAHGALTPGNMLLSSHDRLLISDYALARLHPPSPPYLAPELQHVSEQSLKTGNMSSYWQAANPSSDQYMLAMLCLRLFARLLPESTFEPLIPVLTRASHPEINQRFASIDLFTHELTTQSGRSQPLTPLPRTDSLSGNSSALVDRYATQAMRPEELQQQLRAYGSGANSTLPYERANSQPLPRERNTPQPSGPGRVHSQPLEQSPRNSQPLGARRPTSQPLPSGWGNTPIRGNSQPLTSERGMTPNWDSQPLTSSWGQPLPPLQDNRQQAQHGLHSGQLPSGPDWFDKMMNYHLSTPNSSPVEDWEKLGGKHFSARHYEAALRAYLKAIDFDHGRHSLWLALGDTYFAMENYSEALKAYERAAQLNPNDAQVWSNRGTVLDTLGRHKEAQVCYDRADQLTLS